MIALPMIIMLILGFALALLVNPYLRKIFHKGVDFKLEVDKLQKEVKELKKENTKLSLKVSKYEYEKNKTRSEPSSSFRPVNRP